MYRSALCVALLSSISLSAQAATLNVTSMNFTGGTFAMTWVTPAPIAMAGSNKNLVGGYQNFGHQVDFFGAPMFFFTGDGTDSPYYGTPAAGGPAPTATVDTVAGTLSIDLSSWTANWGGYNMNQGAPNVTGTWDPATGVYNLGWSSMWVGGPFNELYGVYTMTGIAAVPEPEAYVFVLTGLSLVAMAVRRRQSA